MGLIGSALGAVGSIFGGISAAKAANKVKQNLERQKQENQDWYDRRYNEDATQRADAQRILSMTEERIKNRNKAAAGTAAVMGGTEESVAAEKAAGNSALADATAQIAVAGEARKSDIENKYMDNKANINKQLNDLQAQKAQAIGQAVNGLAKAAGQMDFGSASIFGKKVAL